MSRRGDRRLRRELELEALYEHVSIIEQQLQGVKEHLNRLRELIG